MAHGALTPIIALRLLALAAGLRHNAEIGQPGLCFSAYGHKFGINHLLGGERPVEALHEGELLDRQPPELRRERLRRIAGDDGQAVERCSGTASSSLTSGSRATS